MPTTEEVPPEPRVHPKIGDILELLKVGGDLEAAEKRAGESLAEQGKIYQKIEKNLHGNRAAVSIIRRMQKMSADKRNDMIRTLEPLMVELGYTLDHIDPTDLVAQSAQPATEPQTDDDEDDAGDNSAASPLDSARARLSGTEHDRQAGLAAQAADKERAAAANGSVQLRKFVGALRAGRSFDDAVDISGIDGKEANMHADAERKGEYAEVEGINPPPVKAKPKLGIVSPGSEARQ